MIEVQSLSKKFGSEWALRKTSWSLGDKKAVGLLGPNGAGKSTTMKIMTGLLCATEGQVVIDGMNIMTNPVEVKRKIGYLPETPPLYEELRVYDFFDFVCGLKSVIKSDRARQIQRSIEVLNLQEVAFKTIGQLSKGFKQRVGIGQCLIGDPSILILDEPSVGLDPHQVYELRNIIKSLKTDHSVVLSTHILSEVQEVCDEVVILDKGEVKSKGSIASLLSSGKSQRIVQIKLNNFQDHLIQTMKSLPKVVDASFLDSKLEITLSDGADDSLNLLIQPLIEANCGLLEISQKQQKLEDVFIEVTQ